MKVGIIGASGYSGGELLRLLKNHPFFEIEYVAAGSKAGKLIAEIHSNLALFGDRSFEETDVSRMNACELLFFALPPGESAKLIPHINPEIKVIDLGADFRLSSPDAWQKYYGGEHAGKWVYGLPELPARRSEIANSNRIANPGCYATAISLAAAPALVHEAIDGRDLVVVAASGTTGAGRKASENLLASEVMGSITSYKFGGVHQHIPEIEETLSVLTSSPVLISFTPLLAPMPRGILATVSAKLTRSLNTAEAQEIYRNFYEKEEFVTVLPPGLLPKSSAVIGSNSAQLQVVVDMRTNRLMISASIDNLGKGAASQAIQNANIIAGIPENSGLSAVGLGS